MNQTMEKFINFKQLDVVLTGSATTPTGVTLTDTAATFTQHVLPNAIVWDRTTGASTGGQKYLVSVVSSDTVLGLTPIGPVADQGTGVPDGVGYFIYMPEYTKVQYGTTSATLVNFLVDSSASINFILAGVKPGDYVKDLTGGSVALITSVSKNQLGVSEDIFVSGDEYLIYKEGADNFDKIIRSANVADVSNSAVTSSIVNITYDTSGTDVGKIDYAYSSTTGANSDMRGAIQDAIVSSLQTEWTDVTYDFPGLPNAYNSGSNSTWLGGKEYFILRIS